MFSLCRYCTRCTRTFMHTRMLTHTRMYNQVKKMKEVSRTQQAKWSEDKARELDVRERKIHDLEVRVNLFEESNEQLDREHKEAVRALAEKERVLGETLRAVSGGLWKLCDLCNAHARAIA